jgi:hypothetical protein
VVRTHRKKRSARASKQSHQHLAVPYPRLADAANRASEVLSDGLTKTGPHSEKMVKSAKAVESLLVGVERWAKGEIDFRELLELHSRFPESLKGTPRPEWLPPDIALALLRVTRRAETTDKNAPKQLVRWLERNFAPPTGRSRKPGNYSLGKKALVLKHKGRSWMSIAHRLCPERGPAHQCTKLCSDRIRMAAKTIGTTQILAPEENQ